MDTPRINLLNDYNVVAHERVLAALQDHLDDCFEGYGTETETAEAHAILLELAACPQAEVHFLAGGTLANLTALSAFLKPHEAVIAPATAHIAVHETGAIEATGHKVLVCPSEDGKLRPEDVQRVVATHVDEHMVKPRLVYISQTTEYGGVYSKQELLALRAQCDEHKLLLYIDGARLAYALSSNRGDANFPFIASVADAFYFGGTKNGLLFGEALVITNPCLQEDFRFLIKQRGGLVAKGFVLGIQFKALLQDGLYLELAAQANARAAQLSDGLKALGYELEIETETNQVFPLIRKEALAPLQDNIAFEVWNQSDPKLTTIRFVTTWQTTQADIDAVLAIMRCYRLHCPPSSWA